MSNQIVEFMKKELGDKVVDCLYGELTFKGEECILGPRGGVYGIAIELTEDQVKSFFKHNEKSNIKFSQWKPIGDNFYPLYWGKDSNLGFRLFDHTKCRETTATLQLNRRDYLKCHKVIYGAVLCADFSDCEKKLHDSAPDIFINHNGLYDYNI